MMKTCSRYNIPKERRRYLSVVPPYSDAWRRITLKPSLISRHMIGRGSVAGIISAPRQVPHANAHTLIGNKMSWTGPDLVGWKWKAVGLSKTKRVPSRSNSTDETTERNMLPRLTTGSTSPPATTTYCTQDQCHQYLPPHPSSPFPLSALSTGFVLFPVSLVPCFTCRAFLFLALSCFPRCLLLKYTSTLMQPDPSVFSLPRLFCFLHTLNLPNTK